MRFRYTIIIIMVMCFCPMLKALAQPSFTVKGVIAKRLSAERIAGVSITNLRSKDFAMSDDLGWFSIKGAIGDSLLFKKTGYTDQKIMIINTGDMPVYMQPVINLTEVKVQGQTTRQELNDVMNDYRKNGTFYNGKPPALSFLTSPITGLYELFGKTPNEAKRFAAFSKEENEYAEVKKRYNVALVRRVTNASDTVARKFMQYYTPSFEDLKDWTDYDLIQHIRTSYDYYDKSPDKAALERLNTPPPLITPDKKKSP